MCLKSIFSYPIKIYGPSFHINEIKILKSAFEYQLEKLVRVTLIINFLSSFSIIFEYKWLLNLTVLSSMINEFVCRRHPSWLRCQVKLNWKWNSFQKLKSFTGKECADELNPYQQLKMGDFQKFCCYVTFFRVFSYSGGENISNFLAPYVCHGVWICM